MRLNRTSKHLLPVSLKCEELYRARPEKRGTVKIHITDDGGAHPEALCDLPYPTEEEWSATSSVAASVTVTLKRAAGAIAAVTHTFWLRISDQKRLSTWRKSSVGRVAFCMSLIEHVQGKAQDPAGPQRFNLDRQLNTMDVKDWEMDSVETKRTRKLFDKWLREHAKNGIFMRLCGERYPSNLV